jgi:hypothetical protein
MPTEVVCTTCGFILWVPSDVRGQALTCPRCQAAVAVRADAELPDDDEDAIPFVEPAEAEGRKDLKGLGIGLIVLGILGTLGGFVFLLHGDFRLLSVEAILLVGIALTILVTIGISLVAPKGGASAGAAFAGGCLYGFTIFAMIALLLLAMIIYTIKDCLDTCSGNKSQPGRRSQMMPTSNWNGQPPAG